jgi:hypothetical protein
VVAGYEALQIRPPYGEAAAARRAVGFATRRGRWELGGEGIVITTHEKVYTTDLTTTGVTIATTR